MSDKQVPSPHKPTAPSNNPEVTEVEYRVTLLDRHGCEAGSGKFDTSTSAQDFGTEAVNDRKNPAVAYALERIVWHLQVTASNQSIVSLEGDRSALRRGGWPVSDE